MDFTSATARPSAIQSSGPSNGLSTTTSPSSATSSAPTRDLASRQWFMTMDKNGVIVPEYITAMHLGLPKYPRIWWHPGFGGIPERVSQKVDDRARASSARTGRILVEPKDG